MSQFGGRCGWKTLPQPTAWKPARLNAPGSVVQSGPASRKWSTNCQARVASGRRPLTDALGLDLADGSADLGDDEGPMDNCGTAVGTEAHTYLFDLKNDPSETMDLSGEKPEVRDALKARLTELMATEAASIWKAETSEAYGAWASHHNCISPWIDAR